jgi:hypothetical protein
LTWLDSRGDSKYVISLGNVLAVQECIHNLVAHSTIDDITLTGMLNVIESAAPASPNSAAARTRVFTLSVRGSDVVDASLVVVSASVLAELELRVQEKLGIRQRIRLQRYSQMTGDAMDITSVDTLPMRCTINIRLALKVEEMNVKQRIMDLNEQRLIALEREEYEECGRIRDEIRQLEASILDVSIKQHRATQQGTDEAMIKRR